jgi:predicted  nucleic acid-binding Zn-ribbon protein
VDGRCTACQIVLRLQYYQDLKRGENVLSCESCHRILYWNPPQSVEDFDGGRRVAMS